MNTISKKKGNQMNRLKKTMLTISLFALLANVSMAQPVKVDEKIPKYKKTTGIKGNLNSIGSDTILNIMTLWAEGFQTIYPDVKIQIEGKGSSTAPPALIEGTAQIGPMSRKMKSKEIDAFEEKYGFEPLELSTAMDALAVYVNKSNPIEGMTIPQVDAVFSKTRKHGYKDDISTWEQLDLKGVWNNKPISIYGRNSASGTYGFFKDEALKKGDYKDEVKEQPGSASVVQSVSSDKYGIGYSGIGYKTSGVKAVSIAEEGGKYYAPNSDNVNSGNYPLSRFLYLYVAKQPNKEIDPLVKEFLKYVFSYEGQQVVVKDGYLPLQYEVVGEQLQKLN